MANLEFVAFDTETTGIWAPTNRIVEIGAVKFRLNESRADRFQTLVNPEREIPVEVIEIHGITNGMVKNAATIKTVLSDFADFCGPDSILIAHNALFDISFVGCESDRVGLDLMKNLSLDTVDLLRQYRPGLSSYSLASLMRHFKLGREQNHRAGDDAALVWKLFTMIAEDFPVTYSRGDFKRAFTFYSMSQWQGREKPLPDRYRLIGKAMKEDLALDITYVTNGQPPHERTIWPKRIHNLKSTFYVTAYCEYARDERTFRLDRIQSFRLSRSDD
jgi:DNA polymerase III epsilon subunit family exonuclease